MIAVLSWLAMLAAGGVAVMTGMQAATCARQHDRPGARASATAALAAVCVAVCAVTVIGIIPALLGLLLSTVAAFGALGVIWRDGREPWDVVLAAARAVRHSWEPSPPDPADLPADELAPRRDRREAADLPEAVPGTAPPTVPPSGKGNPAVTMPPPPPPPEGQPQGGPPPAGSMPAGSAADIFTAVQQIILRAQAEGMPGKHRAIKMFAEMHDYLSRAEHEFARRMSEPDQGYPPQVWEPLAKMAGHSRAASLAAGESDQALAALARMPVGDLAVSPVRSPHSNELNAFT